MATFPASASSGGFARQQAIARHMPASVHTLHKYSPQKTNCFIRPPLVSAASSVVSVAIAYRTRGCGISVGFQEIITSLVSEVIRLPSR
jgi:hypothetical protein